MARCLRPNPILPTKMWFVWCTDGEAKVIWTSPRVSWTCGNLGTGCSSCFEHENQSVKESEVNPFHYARNQASSDKESTS